MAALWIPISGRFPVTEHGAGYGYTYLRTGFLTIMSCYLTPSNDIEQFKTKVGSIEERVHAIGGRFIVAGDFNAKAVEWGSRKVHSGHGSKIGSYGDKYLQYSNF